MPNDDGLKGQLGRFFRSALDSAQNVADEVRSSAQRIREQLDNQQFQQEKKELFARLGEETYALYKKGREQVPHILKEKIEQLDRIAGEVITKENLERAGEVMDGVVRGVVEDVNDFLEETIRSRQREQEHGECSRDVTAKADASVRPDAQKPEVAPDALAKSAKSGDKDELAEAENVKTAPKKRSASRKTAAKPSTKKSATSIDKAASPKKAGSKPKTSARRPKKGPVLASDPLAGLRDKSDDNGE
jgi:hypothetical protein